MRLAWLTDIHLDFLAEAAIRALALGVSLERPDAVLLTGDISVASKLEAHLLLLESLWEVPTYFVLGNHDFYGGSFASARAIAEGLLEVAPGLRWLERAGVVSLTSKTALVGHDGWADARAGDPDDASVKMRDWSVIDDLKDLDAQARREALRTLGDRAAEHLAAHLPRAFSDHDEVIVATHPPLFVRACRYLGFQSPPRWLPHLVCAAAGEVVQRAAADHPDKRILCLAGHTHGRARERIAENLRAWTGSARYGAPELQRIIDVT